MIRIVKCNYVLKNKRNLAVRYTQGHIDPSIHRNMNSYFLRQHCWSSQLISLFRHTRRCDCSDCEAVVVVTVAGECGPDIFW